MTSIAEVIRELTVHIDVCKAAPELHTEDMHHLGKNLSSPNLSLTLKR